MKKLIIILMMGLLVAAYAVPTLARSNNNNNEDPGIFKQVEVDVDFNQEIKIEKDKKIKECQFFADVYFTFIFQCYEPDGRALSQVKIYQQNQANNSDYVALYLPYDSITDSFNTVDGVAQVNQSAGSMNNQANVVAAAVSSQESTYATAETVVFQINHEGVDPTGACIQCARTNIYGSFDTVNGIAQINQSPTNYNNQANSVNVAAGTGTMVAVADVQLDQVNVGNNISLPFLNGSQNLISNSFNSVAGVVQVNQSSGYFNNQANVVNVAAATPATQ